MTDQPKWTPGPWVATPDGNGEWGIDSESWGIATVAACAGTEDPNGRSDANANLIAAAPDMYVALQMAQFWLDIDGRYDMQVINAALAKARGQQ